MKQLINGRVKFAILIKISVTRVSFEFETGSAVLYSKRPQVLKLNDESLFKWTGH
jgi:hypothetical protein